MGDPGGHDCPPCVAVIEDIFAFAREGAKDGAVAGPEGALIGAGLGLGIGVVANGGDLPLDTFQVGALRMRTATPFSRCRSRVGVRALSPLKQAKARQLSLLKMEGERHDARCAARGDAARGHTHESATEQPD